MKLPDYLCLLLTSSAVGLLLGGCVIKPARVATRHFVLVPIPRPEHAQANAQPLTVEVTSVKMPAYLLRDSLLIRKSAEEVDYLETSLWAERLDRSFRETVQQNLSVLLALVPADVAASEPERVGLRLSVNVEQFDVDTRGRGTLLADWCLTTAGTYKPRKSGQARLIRTGPFPHGNPQAIVMTLSGLVTEFSTQLAQSLDESGRISQ